MDGKELLIDALAERETIYREKLKLCRDDFSRGAVHDLRTSIRRLLATLDVVAFIGLDSQVRKLSDRLKKQLDGVSDLRDIQVTLDQVAENISALPELEPFQIYLEKREKRKQHAGEKHAKDIKTAGIKKPLRKIREALEGLTARDLNGKFPQAVDEAYLTVIQRYSEVDPKQIAGIHHLRVAFKKFRYMVNVIHPCLSGFPANQLKRMHDYQTQMGHIHDTQVFLETLAKFAEDSDSYDPAPVRRCYEQILANALTVYLESKAEVLTFWRATPLTTFPWEAKEIEKKG